MKFNYIISAYFGTRLTYPNLSGEKLLDTHLEFFNKNYIAFLNRIIIILNIEKSDDIKKLQIIKEKYQKLPITYIVKGNIGGSYYNYELGILNSLSLDTNINYAFVIEDDYMPFDTEFYLPFINKLKEGNNVFVCQKLINYPKGKIHAGVSNGMFDLNKVREYYKKNDKILNVDIQSNDYLTFVKNQRNFLDYLSDEYEIADISEKYCQPFYGETSVITNFGNINGDILIKPIVNDYYFFRKMKISDLEFFLEIRNECADFLHNNNIFTLSDAITWFNENNPEFYIINYNNTDIGYFRTSNHTNDNIYIGCDIHKNFRGKKLAYNAYIRFMNFIFSKYDVSKISLEVLSNNLVAYNLYKKLGFIEDPALKFQKILRNGEYLRSILMSLNKDNFYNNLHKDFEIFFDDETKYKIIITSFSDIEANIFFYDNDTRLWATSNNFLANMSYWYALAVNILDYETIKVVITNKYGNTLCEKNIKITK